MLAQRLLTWFKTHFPLVGALLVLGILLAKNPFSDRTLIPNFDPFPDSFHYVVPPRCFLMGQGWKLCRPGFEGIQPAVPPLYGVTMLPFLLIKNDPRMFYFANIGLSFTALIFFYLILRQLTKNSLILGLVLFLYVTNYFVYWYPALAMAENAILPLFMVSTYFTMRNFKKFNLWQTLSLFGLAIAFYFVKPAYAPLTVVFGGWAAFLFLKHWQKLPAVQKRNCILVGSSLAIVGMAIEGRTISWALLQLFRSKPTSQAIDNWFSVDFMREHIPLYLGTLVGKRFPFLWDQTPMLANWLAIGSLAGLASFFTSKKSALIGSFLLSTIVFQLVFIASFYAIDGRYVYHQIPVLLFGLAFGLEQLRKLATNHTKRLLFVGLLLAISGLYLYQNVLQLKKQVLLNLKYAEQPWWYLSVVDISHYFGTLPQTDKKPFLIVAHPPFLFDFYGNDRFALLPLTQNQDFRNASRQKLWGNYDYSDFNKLYASLLQQGYPMYVTNYGLGNDKGYHADYESIQQTFTTTQVQTGCYNLCNIYKLELKP